MRPIRYTVFAAFFFILGQAINPTYGQLGISFDLKKPQEYDERVLRSEKSDQKKFTLPTRIIQNTVTHYNYFFNANNKLNEVIERAKLAFRDDYSKLLPFYNYELDATAKDSTQLDSIIYKSETGIALHDLRNDWADNLYLLWGAAYYLRKDFDSAFLMFQFINYAFAEKEKDGYYKTIGSNRDGTSAFSISTKEKTSLPQKIFTNPPSRNDAFIWQIRNFLAQDQFAEAASLIVTLRSDPNFPKRLKSDFEEVQAWWFYKQNMWDSAAPHLANALDNATNTRERARWEYLVAQLYELSGNYKEAEKLYTKSIHHTTDPVMDVYARLNLIRVNKSGGENYIDKNIAELLKMARKDKYQDYRDIIYYMAAQMQMERNNIDGALPLLVKSTQYSSGDVTLRNRAFLQLADLAFAQKKYRQAYNFYDSLKLDDPSLTNVAEIKARKEMLGKVAAAIEAVEKEDSLQRIAGMPEEERKDFVKKLVRQLRRQQGLKDEGTGSGNNPFPSTNQPPPTLFTGNEPKGEWYFYNTAYLQKGYSDFVVKWGSRPNVDNWRRSAVTIGMKSQANQNNPPINSTAKNNTNPKDTGDPFSFDALYDNLPLTPEKLQASNDSLHNAMFELGKLYAQDVEDCGSAIQTFESLRNRFPNSAKMDEILFHLYYCYHKTGDNVKAEEIKRLLTDKYPGSNFTTIVTTGKNPQSKSGNPDATQAYEKIYDLFIEGNFDEAIAQKKVADNLYGKNYWTPQLLYIEAVYYIKQRDDSTAKKVLNSIVTQFPKTPLAVKAANLINVLGRRNQIEEELRNLVINRPAQDANNRPPVTVVNNPPVTKIDTVKNKPNQPPPVVMTPPPVDTSARKGVVSPYTFNPDASHYVVLILNKVDPVFVNEAKNAFFRYNRETYYNKIMSGEIVDLDAENRLLLISPFKNAQEAADYITKAKPLAPTEIIPWLKGGKYNFSVISESNLNLLKANKDLGNYQNFINQKFPGKF